MAKQVIIKKSVAPDPGAENAHAALSNISTASASVRAALDNAEKVWAASETTLGQRINVLYNENQDLKNQLETAIANAEADVTKLTHSYELKARDQEANFKEKMANRERELQLQIDTLLKENTQLSNECAKQAEKLRKIAAI